MNNQYKTFDEKGRDMPGLFSILGFSTG